ncbi:nuclear transport factor 2 family protein [Novosphingobium sp.]|uniref:nuclear transport factor 2 family protein n=1 Tax=Novosphingobium sp. TaxID=1874826 RepID=UPI003D13F0C3
MSETTTDWPGAFFADADTLELPRLMAWFADDIELRFGNAPAIHGRADAEQAFTDFWSLIKGMSHSREVLVTEGDTAFQGSLVTYTRADGHVATMPVASNLRRTAAGTLNRLWIYIDLAPLFAQ